MDSRGQGFEGFFSKDFINAFHILSISAMPFLRIPRLPFSIKFKSPCAHYVFNKGHMTSAILPNPCNSQAFHLNP